MIKVLKKNGEVQEFSPDKIKIAIRKSAERVCITLTEKEENKVVNNIKNILKYNDNIMPVSTIHNMVEVALDNINPIVAKSYREFRDNRNAFAAMLDKVYNKKLSLAFIGDRSNANADSALVTTQKAIVYNELNSELYKKFFLNRIEEKAMSDGYIYIHDRGSRLDSVNCCIFDIKNVLKNGFLMGNLEYQEPKTLDVAFDLIADVTMNAAACQYGGFTLSEIDKILAPYAEKSYQLYYQEYFDIIADYHTSLDNCMDDRDHKNADAYATKKVKRDFEQGFQSWEMKFNSVASSRGDYPFTAITFGLGTGKWETMASSVCMKVRKEGQGKPGFKHPVLFPKINFFYDETLHGTGKEFEWLFDEAIDCSSKAMYPDFLACTGEEIYDKFGVPIPRMGCIDYSETIDIAFTESGKKSRKLMIGEIFKHIKDGEGSNYVSNRVQRIVKYIKDPVNREKFERYGYIWYDGELFNQWAIDFNNDHGRKPTRGDVLEFFGYPLHRKSVRQRRGINSKLFNLWDSYLEVKVVDMLVKHGCIEIYDEADCTNDKQFIRNKMFKFKLADGSETAKQIDIYFPMLKIGFEVQDFATHSRVDDELYLINGQPRGDMIYKKGPTYSEEKRQKFAEMGIKVFELWEDEIRSNDFSIITSNIELGPEKEQEIIISQICTETIDYLDLEAINVYRYVKDIDGTYTRIKRILKNKSVTDWLAITLSNNKTITVTTDHPLITLNGQVIAADLEVGHKLLDINDNELQIVKIEKLMRTANSYDIETESHTFVFSDIQSHNCRAKLSPWYPRGGFKQADETDIPVIEGRFNLGAISLHFPMIAAQAQHENRDFYEVLTEYLELVRKIHQRTFSYIAHKKAGTNPLGFCQGGFLNGYKDPEEEIGEDLLRPMTLSFGITALNETSILMTGKSIREDNTFAIEVLKFMNDYVKRIKEEDNLGYAIYGTPAESLCGLQIEQFRKKYGIINGVSDRAYTSNSFHCGVWEDITPIEKQDIEYPMFHLCNGGNIQYCRYITNYNIDAIKTLVKRAMKMGFYEGVNLQLDYCEDCGHQFIDSDKCPKCGSDHLTRIERMNGYLGFSKVKGRTMYADHKLKEFADRKSM